MGTLPPASPPEQRAAASAPAPRGTLPAARCGMEPLVGGSGVLCPSPAPPAPAPHAGGRSAPANFCLGSAQRGKPRRGPDPEFPSASSDVRGGRLLLSASPLVLGKAAAPREEGKAGERGAAEMAEVLWPHPGGVVLGTAPRTDFGGEGKGDPGLGGCWGPPRYDRGAAADRSDSIFRRDCA